MTANQDFNSLKVSFVEKNGSMMETERKTVARWKDIIK